MCCDKIFVVESFFFCKSRWQTVDMKFFKETMVDTLPNSGPLINIFPKYGSKCEYTGKTITEPDNGHKTESLSKLDYRKEGERLKSFKHWKSEAVRPEELAKAGFYFLNNPANPDLVKCAFCNAEICSWESGDDPMDEHRKWSPNCSFIRDKLHTAISPFEFFRSQASGQDVCGNAEIFSNSIPESETFRLLSNMVRNYEDEKIRLESFVKWPKSSKQKPEILAEAGFYYRGVEDHTICFKCGGALRDWKDDDDPWEQHALWFPKCNFLLQSKGSKYVEDVQRKLKSGVPCNNITKEKECEQNVCEQGSSASPDDGILRCKICDSNERNVIFIPCKHILACDECSRQFNNCPVCRKRIDERMKVFLS
ncbi:death-associated inhibitor of apoptosis 1-like isoform X1 [Zophobas morio]|uniref:death-associated inhibitor of apoptosis 1-like isoform X1 n=1 Tax=Zophobas morio TaxID=2755281 RepID=UPI003082A119